MPALVELLARRAGLVLHDANEVVTAAGSEILKSSSPLDKRIYIPCCNYSSSVGLVEASTVDPWSKSGKYALGWVYFCIIILVFAIIKRVHNLWTDKIRTAIHKEQMEQTIKMATPDSDYEMKAFSAALPTDRSTQGFFNKHTQSVEPIHSELSSSSSSNRLVNVTLALFRYILYRPIPPLHSHRLRKHIRPITFPSIGVTLIILAALIFTVCYCFVPKPLYWQSIQDGSPPLAIRAGMIAVAMMPWIVATSMKANMITYLTGVGHERLNILHRWMAYICLLLSLVHTIPFYVTPIWDSGGLKVFRTFFPATGVYIYGTGEPETLHSN